MIAANETVGVIVRPLIDLERSEYVDTDKGREYSRPHVRAFIVGATDTKQGWPDVAVDYDGDRAAPAPVRRREWL